MIFFFPLALIPLGVIFSILVSVIVGAAFSALIVGFTEYLKAQRLLRERLAQLKSRIPTIARSRFELEKLCFEFDSPYQRRLDDIEARASILIAQGGAQERLGNIQLNAVTQNRQLYSEYKMNRWMRDEQIIRWLEREKGFGFWDYVNTRSIAATLRTRMFKNLTAITALLSTIYELLPLIDELIKAIDSTAAEIEDLPDKCNQCSSLNINSSGGDEGFSQSYELIPNDENKTISITFTAYRVPDQLTVSVGGGVIYDSGCIGEGEGGNGQSSVSADVILPANSNSITINVNANCGEGEGTVWKLTIDGVCLK
jgi:hypothetical protein